MQTATPPTVAVLLRSEAFSEVWSGVVAECGGVPLVAETLEELAPLRDACAVLLSLAGSEEQAGEVLDELRSAGSGPVAVVGSAADHRIAVTVMAAGAADYFVLPGELEMLREWVRERVERAGAAERVTERLEHERARYDFSRIVGESPGLRQALDRVARLIPRDNVTVLITGETGTGKELFAEAVHYNGPRAREPFVEVNCAALPENLLEAELFGYEKGAFTDARVAKPGLFEAAHNGPRAREPFVEVNCAALPENLLEAELFGYEKGAFTDARVAKPGLFEAAHKGTLFLDEIGELSPALQAKLLRVLDNKHIRRLGSVRTITVDVRIVAATHADLATMVKDGRFRRDLFYRLNVLRASLPPLRERGNDVVVLAEHFLDRFTREYGLPRPTLLPETRQLLLSYSWPGNIRELRNAIERAVLMGDGELRAEDLLENREPAGDSAGAGTIPFPSTMDEIEQAAARAMVARFDGNKTAAADALRISRTRLYRLLGEDADA